VARDIITRDLSGSLAYARQTGIRFGLLMGLPSLPDDQAVLHDLVGATEERFAMSDVVARVDAAISRAQQATPNDSPGR
jgi:hypothetical protein